MYDVIPVTTNMATACGPTCLKMLLQYYGIDVPLGTLVKECNVNVTGCTDGDLLRVGNAHGLKITRWNMDADGVLPLDRPAIIWWRYTHFVIFAGLNDKGEPVICNPNNGRFAISREVFARFFTGRVLCNGHPDDVIPEDYWGENTSEPDYFDN